MNVVLTSIDLRVPIAALIAIALAAMAFRFYLGWAARADVRRAGAVERALQAYREPHDAPPEPPGSAD